MKLEFILMMYKYEKHCQEEYLFPMGHYENFLWSFIIGAVMFSFWDTMKLRSEYFSKFSKHEFVKYLSVQYVNEGVSF